MTTLEGMTQPTSTRSPGDTIRLVGIVVLGVLDVVIAVFVGAFHHLRLIRVEEAVFCLANAAVCAGYVMKRKPARSHGSS
jgi:hypothetical protein